VITTCSVSLTTKAESYKTTAAAIRTMTQIPLVFMLFTTGFVKLSNGSVFFCSESTM